MTAILLDIDGVLHVSGEAVPGAPDAVRALRDEGHRHRFVTNNTTRARTTLAGELQSIGFDLESEDITGEELPVDGWMSLALELLERGELRLAMRAGATYVMLRGAR